MILHIVTHTVHLPDFAVGNIRKHLLPWRRISEWCHLGIVTIDGTRSMSVHFYFIFSEVNRVGLHSLQELILVNEGDEDDSLPLLLFPIQISLEVNWVGVLQGRVFIYHQTLRRSRPAAPSPQILLRWPHILALFPGLPQLHFFDRLQNVSNQKLNLLEYTIALNHCLFKEGGAF